MKKHKNLPFIKIEWDKKTKQNYICIRAEELDTHYKFNGAPIIANCYIQFNLKNVLKHMYQVLAWICAYYTIENIINYLKSYYN